MSNNYQEEYAFVSQLPQWLQERVKTGVDKGMKGLGPEYAFDTLRVVASLPFCRVIVQPGHNTISVELKRGETVTFPADETVVKILFDPNFAYSIPEDWYRVGALEYLNLIRAEADAAELELVVETANAHRSADRDLRDDTLNRLLRRVSHSVPPSETAVGVASTVPFD